MRGRTPPIAHARFSTRRRYLLARVAEAASPLLRVAARARARGPALPSQAWRRGLILGHTHIGDVLYRTASLPALAAGLPGCAWDMVASPASALVLRGNPYLHEVLPINVGEASWDLAPGGFRRLRDAGYDVVLCTNSENFHPDFALAAALGVPTRVGFPYKGLSALLTFGVDMPSPAPWSAYVRAMFAAVCGLAPDWSLRPQIFPTDIDERDAERTFMEMTGATAGPVIASAITTRQPTAAWPPEHWAEALRPLVAEGATALLCGAPSERSDLERAAAQAGFPVRVVAGELGLTAVAALLRRCAAFVGTDSGLRHVANAAGIPTLFFRNPASDPVETGPYCETEVDLLPGGPLTGAPSLARVLGAHLPPPLVSRALRGVIALDDSRADASAHGPP